MGKGRVLVVEDDIDISKMLRIYFDSQGYEVLVANKGNDALDMCRTKLPNVVVLDIQLPDIDGYEVLRSLRSNTRTSYVPVIFLTQKDERGDKIVGLELGADDYITKPFDIEELKLRVEGAIRRSLREALTYPVTNLPSGKLIEEQLKRIKDSPEPWVLLYFGIRNVNAFKEVYGPIQVNEVLIFLADIMREAVEADGTLNDFIGQFSDNDFMIVSTPKAAPTICYTVGARFNQECGVFYSFKDREQGYITYKDTDGVTQKADFMRIRVGIVSSYDGPFADIVQITEDAAENRRQNLGCPGPEGGYVSLPAYDLSPYVLAKHIQTSKPVPPPVVVKEYPQPERKDPKTLEGILTIEAREKLITDNWEENLDYFAQLENQYSLWESDEPLLAAALFRVNSLTSGKIHDMGQMRSLFDLAITGELSSKTLDVLRTHQQLCLLAYENLKDLRFMELGYEKLQSISLSKTVENMRKLLPALKIFSAGVPPELLVNIPELKLQQAIFNIYNWLLLFHEESELGVSVKVNEGVASINFTYDSVKKHIGLENYMRLKISVDPAPPIVYGYLAQKAVFRYRGYIKSNAGQVSLCLPIAEQMSVPVTSMSHEDLKKKIKERIFRLNGWELSISRYDSNNLADARDLVDVAAGDLLNSFNMMLEALKTESIDINNMPWSIVWRKIWFFQILTLDLRKNYQRKTTQENLVELLDNVKLLLRHRTSEDHKVDIETDIEEPILGIDRMSWLQIFVNLGLNALEAMPEGGQLTFHVKQQVGQYIVEVKDSGRGIPEDNLSDIFELGFSTKKVKGKLERGRGIGLYSVKTYVEQSGGKIKVFSELQKGTTFTVTLPVR